MKSEATKEAYSVRSAADTSELPRQTLDRAIKIKELPATRVGNRLLVLREDLVCWLRMCRDRGYFVRPEVTQADRERLAQVNTRKKRAREESDA